jgi:hypothetical protein
MFFLIFLVILGFSYDGGSFKYETRFVTYAFLDPPLGSSPDKTHISDK